MAKDDIIFHTYIGNPSIVGGRWWPILKSNITAEGYRIYDVSLPVDEAGLDRALRVKPGLIFLYWRWPMDDRRYPDRQAAYLRQLTLIDYAIENKTPVLIFDGDLQPGVEECAEALRFNGNRVVVAAPMLFPKRGYMRLMYPMCYSLPKFVPKLYDFCYIGNNYGRYDEMRGVLGLPFFENKTNLIYGNWLDFSIDRQTPEEIKRDFPFVQFKGRAQSNEVISLLSRAVFTYHFAKPEYNSTGFITMRWQEAATAGCLGLSTTSFRLPSEMKDQFRLNPDKAYADAVAYRSMVLSQYRLLEFISRYDQWSPVLRDLTGIYR